MKRLLDTLAARLGGTPPVAPEVGAGLVCGPVAAVVGRVETWADVMGEDASVSIRDETLVHLQLAPETGPRVNHAAFQLDALEGCTEGPPPDFDAPAFEAGHAAWAEAVLAEGAGAWSLRPDLAFATMMELLTPDGGERA